MEIFFAVIARKALTSLVTRLRRFAEAQLSSDPTVDEDNPSSEEDHGDADTDLLIPSAINSGPPQTGGFSPPVVAGGSAPPRAATELAAPRPSLSRQNLRRLSSLKLGGAATLGGRRASGVGLRRASFTAEDFQVLQQERRSSAGLLMPRRSDANPPGIREPADFRAATASGRGLKNIILGRHIRRTSPAGGRRAGFSSPVNRTHKGIM